MDNIILKVNETDKIIQAVKSILKQVDTEVLSGSKLIAQGKKLTIYLGGGMAVYFYEGVRPSYDIDCEFSYRIHLPKDICAGFIDDDGRERLVLIDTNYAPQLAMMHEDYQEDSWLVKMDDLENIELRVFSPVDLCVSKITRLCETDIQDIQTMVRFGHCTPAEIRERAQDALTGYYGNQRSLQINIDLAISYAEEALKDLAKLGE